MLMKMSNEVEITDGILLFWKITENLPDENFLSAPSMVGDKKFTILVTLGLLTWLYLVLFQHQKQEHKPLKFNKSTLCIRIFFNNKMFEQMRTTFCDLNQQNMSKVKVQNTG